MLRSTGEDLFFGSVLRPALRIRPGAVVGGDDAVAGRFSVFSPEVEAFSVSGDSDPRHVFRINACFAENPGDHPAVGLPHLLHIPLHKAGFRCDRSCRNNFFADLFSPSVKQCGLGRRSAVIQSDKIMHFFSPSRFSGQFPRRRAPSSASGTLSRSAPCATDYLPCGRALRWISRSVLRLPVYQTTPRGG